MPSLTHSFNIGDRVQLDGVLDANNNPIVGAVQWWFVFKDAGGTQRIGYEVLWDSVAHQGAYPSEVVESNLEAESTT